MMQSEDRDRDRVIPEITYNKLRPKIRNIIFEIFFSDGESEVGELNSVTNEFMTLLYDKLERNCQRCGSNGLNCLRVVLIDDTRHEYCKNCGQIQGLFPFKRLQQKR